MKVTWKDLQRSDVVAGACAAGAALVVSLLFGAALQGVVVGAMLGYAVAVSRHKYMAALQQRVRAGDGPEWDVELNGVKVGTVSDATYAAIRLQVFDDVRLYVAQLLNCGRVLMRVFDSMLLSVPLLAFWGLLAVAMFSPESCAEALNQLRAATPASIAKFASFVFSFMMALGLLAAGVNAALMGARYGFVNRFSEATANALRRRLGVAAEGELVLVRWADGVMHFNDELATLRRGK
jgi:hypothetical protein